MQFVPAPSARPTAFTLMYPCATGPRSVLALEPSSRCKAPKRVPLWLRAGRENQRPRRPPIEFRAQQFRATLCIINGSLEPLRPERQSGKFAEKRLESPQPTTRALCNISLTTDGLVSALSAKADIFSADIDVR